jgi:hypothetical protein
VWIIQWRVEWCCKLNQPKMKAHGIEHRLLRSSSEKRWRSARRSHALQHNNSFNRTRNSAALKLKVDSSPVNSGVMRLTHVESDIIS